MFATEWGVRSRDRAQALRALTPIAVGHATSVAPVAARSGIRPVAWRLPLHDGLLRCRIRPHSWQPPRPSARHPGWLPLPCWPLPRSCAALPEEPRAAALAGTRPHRRSTALTTCCRRTSGGAATSITTGSMSMATKVQPPSWRPRRTPRHLDGRDSIAAMSRPHANSAQSVSPPPLHSAIGRWRHRRVAASS